MCRDAGRSSRLGGQTRVRASQCSRRPGRQVRVPPGATLFPLSQQARCLKRHRLVGTPRRLDPSIPLELEASSVAHHRSSPSSPRHGAARATTRRRRSIEPIPSNACASSAQAERTGAKECFFGSPVAVGLPLNGHGMEIKLPSSFFWYDQ
jgi:hypothetical protein